MTDAQQRSDQRGLGMRFAEHPVVQELLDRWVQTAGVGRRDIVVATDFDGTIANLVDDPLSATAVEGSFVALGRLAKLRGVHVAVMSGRSVGDLSQRCLGLPNVWFSADHGEVVLDPDGTARVWEPSGNLLEMEQLVTMAAELTRSFGGTLDVKPGGIALHVREVRAEHRAAVTKVFRDTARGLGGRVLEGSCWLEARFRDGNRGSALRDLVTLIGGRPIVVYAGDDATDESAFEVVRRLPGGLAVYVGSAERPTCGTPVDVTVDGPSAWVEVLGWLAHTLCAKKR